MKPNTNESPLPEATKSQVARDMMVFQAKLFVDGIKDVLMSPLSLLAGLAGILLSRGNPGAPLYELMRLGKRLERWINLFGAAATEESGEPERHDATDTDENQRAEGPAEDAAPTSLTTISEEQELPANPAPRDFDELVDQLQATLLDPQARAKLSSQSKEQLGQVTRRLLGNQPPDSK